MRPSQERLAGESFRAQTSDLWVVARVAVWEQEGAFSRKLELRNSRRRGGVSYVLVGMEKRESIGA